MIPFLDLKILDIIDTKNIYKKDHNVRCKI